MFIGYRILGLHSIGNDYRSGIACIAREIVVLTRALPVDRLLGYRLAHTSPKGRPRVYTAGPRITHGYPVGLVGLRWVYHVIPMTVRKQMSENNV